ncbi:MAG: site-specific DNA-methyltransferase [Elusimicrobia bacterium]|nr:site-specific DNA-methyltransferase [Elusimicrobiota bacterium]
METLRAALGQQLEEEGENAEHFGLNWPGKRKARQIAFAPSTGTLVPVKGEGVNEEETENIFIEGENLEVLKLLQKSYAGQVKMIYIDPPYNTGNDFIYPDNFTAPLETYLKLTGQKDAEGGLLTTNVETSGRFHSTWLSMMYPRLFIARQLLRDDGVIFISIDETEHPNLRMLCGELFGEENFIADMVWAAGRKNDSKYVSISHEYIIAYAKNAEYLKKKGIIWRQHKEGLHDIYAAYRRLRNKHGDAHKLVEVGLKEWFAGLPDTHPAKSHRHYSCVDARGIYFPDNISWPGGGGPTYEVRHPKTKKPVRIPSRGWMTSDPNKMQQWIDEDRVHFGDDETSVPCIKSYLTEREDEVPYSVFYRDGRAATKRLRQILDGDSFENPKDELVLRKIVEFAANKDGIILDFFAGSGTLAHAVLDLNQEDSGNRKFILVQLPEPCNSKSTAFKSGFKTIAEIGKERIRRVIKMLSKNTAKKNKNVGFCVFRLAQSNFCIWQDYSGSDVKELENLFDGHKDPLRDNWKKRDLLTEILLHEGVMLTTPIRKDAAVKKNDVLIIESNERRLLICLDDKLYEESLSAITLGESDTLICLDSALTDEQKLRLSDRGLLKTI